MTKYDMYDEPVKVRYYLNQTIEKSVGFTLHDNENTLGGMCWFMMVRKEHISVSYRYFERTFQSYKKSNREAEWEEYEHYNLTHFWLDISRYRKGMSKNEILLKKEELIRSLRDYFANNFPNVELIKGDEKPVSSHSTGKLRWW